MGGRRSIWVVATLAGASVVALLPVAVASAKAGISVPCTGQSDLVAAINAANAAGGGTINLAAGCDLRSDHRRQQRRKRPARRHHTDHGQRQGGDDRRHRHRPSLRGRWAGR